VHAYWQIYCGSSLSKQKYTLFAIESIRFCPGYPNVYLSSSTYIYDEDFLEIDQSETRIACGGNIILNIKFDKDVACQIMHKRCNLVTNVFTNMTAKAEEIEMFIEDLP
jgi:hypothetical protein